MTDLLEAEMNGITKQNAKDYLEYLYSCDVGSHETMGTTYKTYYNNMKLFLIWLKNNENNRYLLSEDTCKNAVNLIERYINYCRQQGNNNQTINNKLVALSSFYQWALKRNKIKYHPFKDKINRLKVGKLDSRRTSYFLTLHNIIEINIKMELNKRYDLQDKILFNLFLDSACRISAVHSLTIDNLNIENGCFTNIKEKEGYIIDMLFFDHTKQLIKDWLSYRELNNITNRYLFITKYQKNYNQMSKETIRSRIRNIGSIIGIKDLYPHTLRKTMINMITKGGKLEDGSDLANHKGTAVTLAHYVEEKTNLEKRNNLLQIRKKIGLN
ncbi:MAG: tyrosine-type recombinase/integrase [Fusobacteriaceae bacterium]|nr:tyrosine-type recombinase/integrase [Fusobacteriaceae bacterium]